MYYFLALPVPNTEQLHVLMYSCACLAEHCNACMVFVMFFCFGLQLFLTLTLSLSISHSLVLLMLLWGYVQSVFCIYKLEHLFYETVMQFYYQCELNRFLNVHSWVCFLIPKPKFEEAGPCINKCNYWTLLKWLKLQKRLSDYYKEIINYDNFIYRMA